MVGFTHCSLGFRSKWWFQVNGPFEPKDLCRNFIVFKSYRKFSYLALWFKGLKLFKSYEIPMEWHIACGFWRKFSKSSNLLENFLWVYLSHPIPAFFLRSNQMTIPVFFLWFAILCFTLQFLSESCVFLIPLCFSTLWFKGALKVLVRLIRPNWSSPYHTPFGPSPSQAGQW